LERRRHFGLFREEGFGFGSDRHVGGGGKSVCLREEGRESPRCGLRWVYTRLDGPDGCCRSCCTGSYCGGRIHDAAASSWGLALSSLRTTNAR
jgi:hypothetical protein